jgi:hypothetical protein
MGPLYLDEIGVTILLSFRQMHGQPEKKQNSPRSWQLAGGRMKEAEEFHVRIGSCSILQPNKFH